MYVLNSHGIKQLRVFEKLAFMLYVILIVAVLILKGISVILWFNDPVPD